MKIVNLKIHESNSSSVYVDLDKVLIMDITEVAELQKTDHGTIVVPAYNVNATFDNGSKIVVYRDSKKDLCNNWISQNWVKK